MPRTRRSPGEWLRALLDESWTMFTETDVHFFVESDRFCTFLRSRISDGRTVPADTRLAVIEESAVVRHALAESHLEYQPTS